MYRYLSSRLRRAMGAMSVAELSHRSNVGRAVISRILRTRGYVDANRSDVIALATATGVTYEYLADRAISSYATPLTENEHQRRHAALLMDLERLRSRRARSDARPTAANAVHMQWANQQRLEFRWTIDQKCQVVHDHEFVLAEADSFPRALEMAWQVGNDNDS